LRYTQDGKRKWEAVGNDLTPALQEQQARQRALDKPEAPNAEITPPQRSLRGLVGAYLTTKRNRDSRRKATFGVFTCFPFRICRIVLRCAKKRNKKETSMRGNWLQSLMARRSFMVRLGAGAGILGATAISTPLAASPAASDAPWHPARHAQDDWYDQIPGQHRIVFDTTTPDGMALALRFANNYFGANQSAYGLKDSDLAVVIVTRHRSTSFGYTDAMWAKYGKQLSEQAEFTDPKTKEAPKINVYAGPPDGSDQSGVMDALIKKGVQFAVCQMASRAIAGRIAKATGSDTDTIFKEIGANLIPNSHFVPAGIIAVNRAQERGYSFALGV